VRLCCEQGLQLRSDYKRLSAEWVKAEGDLRDGAGPFCERSHRLKDAKEACRIAHSAYWDHLICCEPCREANHGLVGRM